MMITDFELDEALKELKRSYTLDDIVWIRDLRYRQLRLCGEVDSASINELVYLINVINQDDFGIEPEKRKPIFLRVESVGGSVDDGFNLIDTIKSSKTPVYTICTSYAYSMGFMIFLAGEKRYMSENAKCLIHDSSNFICNSSSKVKDTLLFQEKLDKRVKDYVLKNTTINEKLFDKKLRIEWFLFADEAKELGITHHILGVDCDIDDLSAVR